jgi:hypothetical protein
VNEIKIIGKKNKKDLLSILSIYSPNKVVQFQEEEKDKQSFILCRNNVCEAQIFDIKKLVDAIKV